MRRMIVGVGIALCIFCFAGTTEAKGSFPDVKFIARHIGEGEVEYVVEVAGLPKGDNVVFNKLRIRSSLGHCLPELITKDVVVEAGETDLAWKVERADCHNVYLEALDKKANLKNGKCSFKLAFTLPAELPVVPFEFNYGVAYEVNNRIVRADVEQVWGYVGTGGAPQIPIAFYPVKDDVRFTKLRLGETLKLNVESLPAFADYDYEVVAEQEDAGNDLVKKAAVADSTVSHVEALPCMKNCMGKLSVKGTADEMPEVNTSVLDRETRKAWRGKTLALKLVLKKDGKPWLWSQTVHVALM